MITECTALVWVPQPVLHSATQVENEAGEKESVTATGSGPKGLTLSKEPHAGIHRNYARMESIKLDELIRNRVPRVLRLHNVFHGRVSELVSALLEMKSRFENQGARNDLHEVRITGWHDYLSSIGLNPSTFRTWKHRTEAKQLVGIVDPPATATKRKGAGGKLNKPKQNSAQAPATHTAPKDLADAKKQLGATAEAGNTQAVGILAERGQSVTAIDASPLTKKDNRASNSGVAMNPTESESAGMRLAEESDWKQVLIGLLQVLEQSGDRLPLVVLKEKRRIESLLAGKRLGQEESASFTAPIKPYNKVMKRDAEGNDRWLVMAEGEKQAWGTFEVESDADSAIADLRSPVVSLMATDSASKMLPASETRISRGRAGLHESAV